MDFIDQLKPFMEWIHLHPSWAGFVIFLIAMSESLAVIGLIIPGTIIMSAVGTLVGAHIIPIIPTLLWAISGAIFGDITSYYLGQLFNERIPNMWPFRRYPHWLEKAKDFFNRHGGKSIFLGRFLGPMRPITPIVAGMMKMPAWRFCLASFFASLLWAPAYMLPGMLIGAASQELEPATATRFLITVVIALVLLWLTMWFFKWLLVVFLRFISRQINALWHYGQTHRYTRAFCNWLRDPAAPQSHSQLSLFISLLGMAFLTLWIDWDTIHQGLLTYANKPVHQLLLNLHQAYATRILAAITLLGSTVVMIPTIGVVFIWLLIKRQWQTAWHWLLGPILIMGILDLNDLWVYYPRPSGLSETYITNSFPSARTALSIAVYGFFGVIITRTMDIALRRQVIYYTVITLCSLIIFSRLYLGMHWLTDVIGGIFCGALVLLMVSLSFRRHPIYPISAGKLSAVFITMIALTWSLQVVQNYREFNSSFTPFWPSYRVNLQHWWQQRPQSQPLYRSNRVGHPVQIMNVQWLDNLEEVKSELTRQGWTVQTNSWFINMINSLSSHDKEKRTPILQPLYLGQKPIIVATKRNKALKQIILLQLWHSKITLTDTDFPLWVGTIEYRQPHPRKFWETHNYKRKYIDYPSPISELHDLPGKYVTKILRYPPTHRPPTVSAYEWNGGIIFIKPL